MRKYGIDPKDLTNVPCERCGRKDMPLFPNYVCINCATPEELVKYRGLKTEVRTLVFARAQEKNMTLKA